MNTTKSTFIKFYLLGALFATTNTWNVINAQENSAALEEIIVTAQKRQENLQTLGISVSAFDQDTLNSMGTRDIVELSKFVPNLQIGTESSDLKAMIRGVGSDNLEAFSDPGVAIHIDGVYQARPSGGNALYYDMERVEVLRGPQGTLYGRNANGGAINFISNKPSNEFEASMDYGMGDNSWKRFRGMVNLPMGDNMGLRIAGSGLFGFPHNETQDGYQENLIAGGTEGNDKDDATSKLQFLWQPTEKVSLLFAGGETHKEGVGPIRKRTNTPGAGTLSPSGTSANCGDCGFVASGGLREVYKDTEESFDLLTRSYSLTLDYDLGFATLTAIAADQSTDMGLVQDSDQSPRAKGIPGGTTDSAVVTQMSDQQTLEVRLTSADEGSVEWLLGLYYLEENAFQNTVINRDPTFGAAKTINVLHDVNAESSAVFGQFSVQPNDTLKLTAGFRSTSDDKDAVGGTKVQIRPPAPGCNDSWPYCYVNVGSQSYSPEDSWSSSTYKFGIDKYINDDRMVYATVSTGYKAGGFNFGVSSAESYDPEEVTAFEIGSKNRFNDGRMQLNASVFYYDYTDLQVFQVVDQTIVVRNAAEADISGAELEFVAALSDNLRVDASLGVLDTEYKKFILPSNLFLDASGEPTNIDVSGNQLINAPRWSGHIGGEHDFANGRFGTFTLRGQLYLSDDMYLRALNLEPYDHQKGYTTLDVKVMWKSADNRWFGEAFFNNLTDEDVITNQEVTDSGIYFANLNRPRSWGVVVGVRF